MFSSQYIVKVIESYELNAMQNIVMEYCNAGDLRQKIDKFKYQNSKFTPDVQFIFIQ